MHQAGYNSEAVASWIPLVHGESAGHIWIGGPQQGGFAGATFPVDDTTAAVDYVTSLNDAGVRGIYMRCTTMGQPPRFGKRGGDSDSLSLPGLWADIDLAGPGHKHVPNRPDLPGYDPKKRETHPLPPDAETGLQFLAEAGLPEPTMIVHSGGGLYPWWLFDAPIDVQQFGVDRATAFSKAWQAGISAAAARLGYHYGAEVYDLSRVLRIPGTLNLKTDEPRPCRLVPDAGCGVYYPSGDLLEVGRGLAAAASREREQQQQQQQRSRPVSAPSPKPAGGGESPVDEFNRASSWADILEPHGWQLHHTGGDGTAYWTRPGKDRRDGVSATTGHSDDGVDRMWVFSSAAGLPEQEPMSKAHVWGMLNGHGGATPAAAGALAAAGFGARRILPEVDVSAARFTPSPSQPAEPPPAQAPVPVVVESPTAGLPDFPLDALPATIRNMVLTVATNKQVCYSMPALFALSALSAVAAPRVQVMRHSGWTECLVFNGVSVAGSGERKSPTARDVFGPFRELERQAAARYVEQVQGEIDALDAQRGAPGLGAAAANRIEDKIRELEELAKRPPRLRLPNDITPEAMVFALARRGGSGAILDAEGTILAALTGRYSNGNPQVDAVIAGYDGDPYHTARIGRAGEEIDRTVLTLGIATQPGVLESAFGSGSKAKLLRDKGLLARLVFGYARDRVGTRFDEDVVPLDRGAMTEWARTLQFVADMPEVDGSGDPDMIPTLCLSPGAASAHRDYSNHVERRLCSATFGDLSGEGIREWANKHPGRVLRIAGLLHLAQWRGVTAEISEETMRGAIAIGEWAIAHAKFAHRVETEGEDEATSRQRDQVLVWARKRAGGGKFDFTARDVCRGLNAAWAKTAAVKDALDQLAELGAVAPRPYLDKAGRARMGWRVVVPGQQQAPAPESPPVPAAVSAPAPAPAPAPAASVAAPRGGRVVSQGGVTPGPDTSGPIWSTIGQDPYSGRNRDDFDQVGPWQGGS